MGPLNCPDESIQQTISSINLVSSCAELLFFSISAAYTYTTRPFHQSEIPYRTLWSSLDKKTRAWIFTPFAELQRVSVVADD